MVTRRFTAGERKRIDWDVTSRRRYERVTVTDARYCLRDAAGTLVEGGQCRFENGGLSVLLEVDQPGWYVLEVTCGIADEIRKTKVIIIVG